ncbi:MAG: sigma-70 family RNA polymerase sigma factor [Bacteroidales bacterium]
MDDNRVIEEIRAGNREALENIYTMYRKGFIQWTVNTWRITQDEAVDLYQQSILAMYENIASGRLASISGTIRTYLFAIGKNKVHELQRYHGRILLSEDPWTGAREEDPGADPGNRERLIALSRACLDKLGEPCREILESFYYCRKSLDQIARSMGYKNEQTAKNQKYKCLLRLRELFVAEVSKQGIAYE